MRNNKKLLRGAAGLLCAALLGATGMPVAAEEPETFTSGDLTCVYLDDGTVGIYKCAKGVTSMDIPAQIEGKPVTAILSSAFNWVDTMTHVSIPDSVTYLGQGSFYHCDALTDLDFGSGVTYIDSSAFWGCAALEHVTIPGNVEYIGMDAFYECPSLKSVTLGDGVKYIEHDAFWRCRALEQLDLGTTVEYIGKGAFSECKALTEVDIPASTVFLGGFNECTSLERVNIAEGVTTIDGSCFYGCEKLTEANIPESVTYIGAHAFQKTPFGSEPAGVNAPVIRDGWVLDYAGRALGENQYLVLDDSVRGIASYALYSADLITLDTGNGVKYIGDFAFGNLVTKSVHLGNSVLTLGDNNGGKALEEINLPKSLMRVGKENFVYSAWAAAQPDGPLLLDGWVVGCNMDSTETGSLSFLHEDTVYNIPEGVVGIADSALSSRYFRQDQEHLIGVTLPSTLQYIGNAAFRGCTNLTEITLPEGVAAIGEGAFAKTGLTSLTIPAATVYIGEYAMGYSYNSEISQYCDPSADFTVIGYEDSAAQDYALENGFAFRSLGEADFGMLGDVNGDGTIDLRDLILLQKYILGVQTFTLPQTLRADVTQDAAVDVFDLAILKRALTAMA